MKTTCILLGFLGGFALVGTMDYNDNVAMDKASHTRQIAETQVTQAMRDKQLMQRANEMMYPLAQAAIK